MSAKQKTPKAKAAKAHVRKPVTYTRDLGLKICEEVAMRRPLTEVCAALWARSALHAAPPSISDDDFLEELQRRCFRLRTEQAQVVFWRDSSRKRLMKNMHVRIPTRDWMKLRATRGRYVSTPPPTLVRFAAQAHKGRGRPCFLLGA